MKNGENKLFELSSSYRRRSPHVHLDHNDHNEDQYSHHEQDERQPNERPVAQEQQDKQLKSGQLRQKKTARDHHHEDESPHYKPQQEH
jgi:hypothetical protein